MTRHNRRAFLLAATGAIAGLSSRLHGGDYNERPKLFLPLKPQTADLLPYDFEGFQNADGNAVSAHDFAGKYVLVYGGYPECTGVCPGAARSLVGTLKNLRAANPALSASIVPLVVIIKNNPGQDSRAIQARAQKWQNEGLAHAETGIRVLWSADQEALDQYMKAFHIRISDNGSGALNHSGWAYLFGTDGVMLQDDQGRFAAGLLPTREGPEVFEKALLERIKKPEPVAGLRFEF